MKQFTTMEQTRCLSGFGFPAPKNVSGYSIGELIEMLPKTIIHKIRFGKDKDKEGAWGLRIDTCGTEFCWDISYERPYSVPLYLKSRSELIDVLYEMVVSLKVEEII